MALGWMAAGAAVGGALNYFGATGAANTQAGAANHASDVQQQMFNVTQGNLQPWMQAGGVALSDLMYGLGFPGGGQPQGAGMQGGGGMPSNVVPWAQASNAQPGSITQSPDGSWQQLVLDSSGVGSWNPVAAPQSQAPGGMQGGIAGGQQPTVPFGAFSQPFGMAQFQESPAYQFNLQQGMDAINKRAAASQSYYDPSTLRDISRFSQGLASNEFQNAFSNYNTNLGNIWNRISGISGAGQNAAAGIGSMGANAAASIGNNITGAGNAQAAGIVGGTNALSGGINNFQNAYLMNQLLAGQQGGGGGNAGSGGYGYGGYAGGGP